MLLFAGSLGAFEAAAIVVDAACDTRGLTPFLLNNRFAW